MKSLSGQPSPTRDAEAPAPRRKDDGGWTRPSAVSPSALALCCLKPRRGDMFVAPGPPYPLSFCFSAARVHPRPKGAQAFLPARGESVRAAPPKNKRRNPGTFAFYKHAAPLGLAAGYGSALPKRSRPAVWPSGSRCDSGAGFGNKSGSPLFSVESELRQAEFAGDIGTLVAVTHHTGSAVTAGTYYAHHNHRGDIVATRSGTSTAGTYEYRAFGALKSQAGAAVCRFQFSSKERDASTGFSYYGHRFYAPQWQRWLSLDPLGGPAFDLSFWLLTLLHSESLSALSAFGIVLSEPNGYTFAFNEPITSIDVDGLSIQSACDLCYVTPAMLDAHQSYRDAIDRLNKKYGEGNWPDKIEEYMDKWRKELISQFGSCVAEPIVKTVPGTSSKLFSEVARAFS